jgi:hypothetical protein
MKGIHRISPYSPSPEEQRAASRAPRQAVGRRAVMATGGTIRRVAAERI